MARVINDAESLAGSAVQLRSILSIIPDATVIIDEHGTVRSFSPAAERMFDFAESEVVGQNVSMLMPAPDRDRHDSYLRNYRETGIRKIIGIGRVTVGQRRDGTTFPIELSVGESSIEGKRIFVGVIHDLSERQKTAVMLRDLQSELAHFGRLSELGSLASSLAHELNQPLTAITNYCQGASHLLEMNYQKLVEARELLESPAEPEVTAAEPGQPSTDLANRCGAVSSMLEINQEKLQSAREALQDATQQAIRAGQIVRRMREFLSHGEAEHRKESLTQLVAEANALALVGTREHGIGVQIELDPDGNNVFVDRIQIQQVLFNLIRNGVESMLDRPERSLTISSVEGPRGFVTVSVEDSGSGISERIAAQLFEPFITSKQGGMGLGLSICRTIVESHGGRIWFEPARDGGTIFSFTIPKEEAEDEQS